MNKEAQDLLIESVSINVKSYFDKYKLPYEEKTFADLEKMVKLINLQKTISSKLSE